MTTPSEREAAEREEVRAEAARTREAREEFAAIDFDPRTVALIVLTVLAVIYTLYFADGIILPLLFAMLLNLLLQPAKRLLHERLRIPAPLTALLLLTVLFAVIGGVMTALSVPAAGWIARAPESLPKLRERLDFLAGPIDFVRKSVDQVQHLAQQAPADGQQQVAVQQQGSGIGGVGLTLLQGTRTVFGHALTIGVVLFYLLTAGDSLLRRLVEIMPTFGDKRRVVQIAEKIEANVSSYLVTITVMNLFVGAANGLSMWLLGMPDPLLWGTLAFLLNYVPILGPVTGMVIFFFVGLFSAPSIGGAILPPLIYLGIHVAEGETITPMLLAQRFTLNPVLLIISLFFWDWLWGVPGALLAVPLLAITKIIFDSVAVLTPLGHLLGAPKERGFLSRLMSR